MPSLADFEATAIDGSRVDLASYAGQVVLVVNTASQCGYTGQYAGLQALQERYAARGFSVLGFPSDQFNQEPESETEIASFCERTYGVRFPMFAKVAVNGAQAHPLFVWLSSEQAGLFGRRITWNFTKFLVGRDGVVLGRYAPTTGPEAIAEDIEEALAAAA